MSGKTPKVSGDDRPPLFTVRSALILLLAFLAGVLIAILMIAAGNPAAAAALAGLGAFGGTLVASHQMIT